ncbi:hypothetical protein [Vallitalea guaymasensis]|uniref:Uncharacterized protein n=1 Tax=Vallitalea guaymasensis TaxID=1185412 RepID=A0A8J8MD09_9FIRM|nr:hypothetical protein [Vallitalea guaymasensis]QUH30574.1 hypothetical protein HYG85_17315 [Vallitalea guaymasensis]
MKKITSVLLSLIMIISLFTINSNASSSDEKITLTSWIINENLVQDAFNKCEIPEKNKESKLYIEKIDILNNTINIVGEINSSRFSLIGKLYKSRKSDQGIYVADVKDEFNNFKIHLLELNFNSNQKAVFNKQIIEEPIFTLYMSDNNGNIILTEDKLSKVIDNNRLKIETMASSRIDSFWFIDLLKPIKSIVIKSSEVQQMIELRANEKNNNTFINNKSISNSIVSSELLNKINYNSVLLDDIISNVEAKRKVSLNTLTTTRSTQGYLWAGDIHIDYYKPGWDTYTYKMCPYVDGLIADIPKAGSGTWTSSLRMSESVYINDVHYPELENLFKIKNAEVKIGAGNNTQIASRIIGGTYHKGGGIDTSKTIKAWLSLATNNIPVVSDVNKVYKFINSIKPVYSPVTITKGDLQNLGVDKRAVYVKYDSDTYLADGVDHFDINLSCLVMDNNLVKNVNTQSVIQWKFDVYFTTIHKESYSYDNTTEEKDYESNVW